MALGFRHVIEDGRAGAQRRCIHGIEFRPNSPDIFFSSLFFSFHALESHKDHFFLASFSYASSEVPGKLNDVTSGPEGLG